MVTQSWYEKREIDEWQRKKDFVAVHDKVFGYLSNPPTGRKSQKRLETASKVVDAMRERKILELGKTDNAAWLVPLTCYYVQTEHPVVISLATFELQKQLIAEFRAIYRDLTGERAKIMSVPGNPAQIIVVHGEEDRKLSPEGLRFSDLRGQVIISDCIVFCTHEFLIRDFETHPDKFDITNRLFPAKYDMFMIAETDKLNESAAKAAGVVWDHKAALSLLNSLLFYAESMESETDIKNKVGDEILCAQDPIYTGPIRQAKDTLAALRRKLDKVDEVKPGDFDQLRKEMQEVGFKPVQEWGGFHTLERQATKNVLDQEMARQLDMLEKISRHKKDERFRVERRRRNTYVHVPEDLENVNGVEQLKKIIGADEDHSLIMAR